MACVNCGINVPPLEPRSFSFNSAYGACKRCHGLGTVMEIDSLKLIPDPWQTLGEARVHGHSGQSKAPPISAVLCSRSANTSTPIQRRLLPTCRRKYTTGSCTELTGKSLFPRGLYSYQNEWKGALKWLQERLSEAPSEKVRVALEELVSPTVCSDVPTAGACVLIRCRGTGGAGVALPNTRRCQSKIAVEAFEQVQLNPREEQIAGPILREIKNRCGF
jgi:excinuclease ABC subunit A